MVGAAVRKTTLNFAQWVWPLGPAGAVGECGGAVDPNPGFGGGWGKGEKPVALVNGPNTRSLDGTRVTPAPPQRADRGSVDGVSKAPSSPPVLGWARVRGKGHDCTHRRKGWEGVTKCPSVCAGAASDTPGPLDSEWGVRLRGGPREVRAARGMGCPLCSITSCFPCRGGS